MLKPRVRGLSYPCSTLIPIILGSSGSGIIINPNFQPNRWTWTWLLNLGMQHFIGFYYWSHMNRDTSNYVNHSGQIFMWMLQLWGCKAYPKLHSGTNKLQKSLHINDCLLKLIQIYYFLLRFGCHSCCWITPAMPKRGSCLLLSLWPGSTLWQGLFSSKWTTGFSFSIAKISQVF